MTEAPVRVLGLSATTIGTSPEATPALSWLALPTPLTLSPFEELRALAFIPGTTRTSQPTWIYAPCVSYHPSTPDRLSYVRHTDDTASELIQHQVPLYEPLKRFGDVEIGFMVAPTSTLVVQKAGKPPQLISPYALGFMGLELPFQRRWMGERGGEFHILSFLPQDMSTGVMPLVAQWWLLRVSADGSVKEEALSPASVTPGLAYFGEYKESMGSAGETFDVVGTPVGRDLPEGKALKTSWKWNEKTRAYDAKEEFVSLRSLLR